MVKAELMSMSQWERDVLKVMALSLLGKRTQAEAGRLLGLCVRQVRRIEGRFAAGGRWREILHRVRGRPGNHRIDKRVKTRVLEAYQRQYPDFIACQREVAGGGVEGQAETLRQWLLEAGLWSRKRRRDHHRSRQERRACAGELVQMDSSAFPAHPRRVVARKRWSCWR